MHRIVSTILYTLFPRRDTEVFVSNLSSLPRIAHYPIAHHPFPIYSLGRYDTPLWHALMYEIKFHKNKRAVQLVAPHLRAALDTIAQNTHGSFMQKNDVYIVPIPLHPSRMRARGYNQVTFVLEETLNLAPHTIPDLAQTHRSDLCSSRALLRKNMLERIAHRTEQKTLNKTKREENVADSFAVPDRARHVVRDAHIILVDDVCATGATVREAARALTRAGAASVTILVLCNS